MMLIESMIIAFAMYSKIPMPRIEWNEKNMKYACCFFPVVGVVIGVVMYIVGSLGIKNGMGKILFAAVMTSLPVIITGGIHLDGFLDTVDAISSFGDREKRLAILKDPNAGAFAVIGGMVYFTLSLGLWSEVSQKGLSILSIGYVLSRTLSGLSVVSFPLAKNTGLAMTFQSSAHRKHCKRVMIIYLIIEVLLMLCIQPLVAIGCLVGAIGTFGYHYYLCKTQFGGITGDLAGYFLQNCELVMLVVVVIMG